MRRAAKVDANQKAIVQALRQVPGVTVRVMSHVGGGFPDLLVRYQRWGEWRTIGLEVKNGKQARLTQAEAKFHADFPEFARVAWSVGIALAYVGVLR